MSKGSNQIFTSEHWCRVLLIPLQYKYCARADPIVTTQRVFFFFPWPFHQKSHKFGAFPHCLFTLAKVKSSVEIDLLVHSPSWAGQVIPPLNSLFVALWQPGGSAFSRTSCFGFARSEHLCEQSTGLCSGAKWSKDLLLQSWWAYVRILMVYSWSCPENLELSFHFQTVTAFQTIWFLGCSVDIFCLQNFALVEIRSARININDAVFAMWNRK